MASSDDSPGAPGPGSPRAAPDRRYPLHVTIATVFAALLLLFGLALIGYNYRESRRITLLAADDLMDRIARQVGSDITGLYLPAQRLVDISAHALDADASSLEHRLARLGYFAEALRLTPQLDSLYLGYGDGDFFLVRSLSGRRETARIVEAPAGTRFVVQSVEREDGVVTAAGLRFYDEALRLLERREEATSDYDPRRRDWYRRAIATGEAIASDFYPFYTTGQVGITFARRLARGGGVVAADLTLQDFSEGLAAQRVTPSTRILVVDEDGTVIGLSDAGRSVPLVRSPPGEELDLIDVTELGDGVYAALAERLAPPREGRFEVEAGGRDWLASISRLPSREGRAAYLSILVPQDELLAEVDRVRDQSLAFSLLLLLAAIAVALWLSRHIAASLRTLAGEAEQIRRLRFDRPITLRSRIAEVAELAATMGAMKAAIRQFLAISKALSAEKDYARVMEMILAEARSVARADGGALLLLADDERSLETAIVVNDRTGTHHGGSSGRAPPFAPVPLAEPDAGDPRDVDRQVAVTGEVLRLDDLAGETRYQCAGLRARFETGDYRCRSLLALPMRNQKDEIIGVLQLVNARDGEGALTGFGDALVPYMEALTADAAVALDLRRLLAAQRDLLDAFIHVIAGAIDAKSPYTSGHCQRVPELARMLAEAAQASEAGPFADFRLDEDGWHELHIASWLHDCGKVTTPEYVVDKATKLETIHNRIHEIRTRFEVLWRDAEIAYYRALAEGGQDAQALRRRLQERLEGIREDFAFVAECNRGGELMEDARIERLREIAARTWTRHLDDGLGLSQDEAARRPEGPAPTLPVQECLLADKPEHVVPRDPQRHPFGDNALGFRMEVPENEYNHGELYNLSVRRGTLTPEERFKINDHIVQTLIMLERLPFPRELRRVPDWAANHHERMDGNGYPRGLTGGQMSVPERIMAIADVYEALTAADRPYKTGKTLSESLRIMRLMRDDGHIDPELFELLVTSGVYRRYAERFLDPAQIDAVDVEAVLHGPQST